MIRNLTAADVQLAKLFIAQAAPHIAFYMVHQFMEDLHHITVSLVNMEGDYHPFAQQLQDTLKSSKAQLHQELQRLGERYGRFGELIQDYRHMLAVAEQKRYQNLPAGTQSLRTLSEGQMIETIYSIGDARFLYTVLNGLVMVVNDPEFLMTIKIGFTIGAFYLALQGLMAGKFPAFQHLLLSLLIYSALFGLPSAGKSYKGIDVDIYDVYTDTNRKVDNVPFGIALTASMLSTLTWKLTETFEQTFHSVDATKLTRNGYLSSLTRMMEARSKAMNQFQNNPALAQSWRNYIKECTLIGIDLNFKTVHEVFNNSDVLVALEFPSEVFGTLIYRNGQPTNVTCTEAFTWLKPRMVNWFDQQIQKDNTSPDRNLSLNSALQALSQGAESSRNFLMASALLPIYHDATIEKLQDMQQPQAAIMTQQAILQRNTQWAGEQHLFLSSMRAMMAYIEGFVFAVTPLMGLLVCVGLFGVRLAFKYLMLLLWIQLWMPVLAINNLYITLVSQGAMAALSAPITSFTGIMESGPDSGILVRRRWTNGSIHSCIWF